MGTYDKKKRWLFDNCMLNRKENYGYITEVMKRFWERSKGSIEDHGVIRDTFKAFLRGI